MRVFPMLSTSFSGRIFARFLDVSSGLSWSGTSDFGDLFTKSQLIIAADLDFFSVKFFDFTLVCLSKRNDMSLIFVWVAKHDYHPSRFNEVVSDKAFLRIGLAGVFVYHQAAGKHQPSGQQWKSSFLDILFVLGFVTRKFHASIIHIKVCIYQALVIFILSELMQGGWPQSAEVA